MSDGGGHGKASDMLLKYAWLLTYDARLKASIEDADKYLQMKQRAATR
jgi:hypothetical protein